MKREEILKLIEEKEAKDLVFKTRGEENAKRTEEIFHIIKQDVMDKVVEHCIECGYEISSGYLRKLIYEALLDSETTRLTKVNSEVVWKDTSYCGWFEIKIKGDFESEDLLECLDSYDNSLLRENIELLMTKHGFVRNPWGLDTEYKITKEKLLSFSEIISNEHEISKTPDRDVPEYNPELRSVQESLVKPSSSKTIKNPLYGVHFRDANLVTNMEKDNTLTYQVLGVIAFFIILFIWKFCF